MRRTTPLINNETYHIYTKSIYGYVIFPTEKEYTRMLNLIKYYYFQNNGPSFSRFADTLYYRENGFNTALNRLRPPTSKGQVDNVSIKILAFCLMPTHLHLILKQEKDNGIQNFMSRILGGFTLYFNKLHNRKGPLWQERFGSSLIKDDNQLAEKIAYVHNNPVKDLGYRRPEDWKYSSSRINLRNPRDYGG